MKELNPERQLALAVKLAAEGHMNQKDKGGNPYILHPIKVMHYLKTNDMELMAIAVMHDLLEDTNMIAADLVILGFSQRVIGGVVRLTKVKGQKPQDYLKGILMCEDACRVKLCDLRHNTDICRLPEITEKDCIRLQKYHKMSRQIKEMIDWYSHNSIYDDSFGGDWMDYRDEKVEEILSDSFSN